MVSPETKLGIVESRAWVTELLVELGLEQERKKEALRRTEELQIEVDELRCVQDILQVASKLMYENLSVKLGHIITEGLLLVFPESELEFCVSFVERRNQIECDLYLQDAEGTKYDVINSVGGGITDFVSILLRIVFIALSQNVNVIFADEPGKFISRDKIHDATMFLAKVCDDLDFSLVVVTHITEMVEAAKAVYQVRRASRVSTTRKLR
jgi:DNA repair exonuclease SbcCD ATPase subunit